MADKIPTKGEIFSMVDAQGGTIDSISKRLGSLEQKLDKQDSKNHNIVIGVLVAMVLIGLTVAAEVMLSNKIERGYYYDFQKSTFDLIHDQDYKIQDLNNRFDNLKTRNYLK